MAESSACAVSSSLTRHRVRSSDVCTRATPAHAPTCDRLASNDAKDWRHSGAAGVKGKGARTSQGPQGAWKRYRPTAVGGSASGRRPSARRVRLLVPSACSTATTTKPCTCSEFGSGCETSTCVGLGDESLATTHGARAHRRARPLPPLDSPERRAQWPEGSGCRGCRGSRERSRRPAGAAGAASALPRHFHQPLLRRRCPPEGEAAARHARRGWLLWCPARR